MKYFSLLAIALLLLNSAAFAAQVPQGTSQGVKVKDEIRERGIGEQSRVKAKLVNGTEVKGYVSKIEETSFDVTSKTGQATTVAYAEVQNIHGPGLSKGAKIGIGVGVAVVGLAIVFGLIAARAAGKI